MHCLNEKDGAITFKNDFADVNYKSHEEVNTMKREEFLKIQDELQNKLFWVICVDCEAFADFCIGCFYDEKEEKWKV